MIKARSLNATLPIIIIICYIYITAKAGPPERGGYMTTLQNVQGPYKMYKNLIRCTRCTRCTRYTRCIRTLRNTQLEFDFDLRCYDSQ